MPVLVFIPVSIDLYRTVLALLYVGAVPVFLDEWVSLARVKQCCAVVHPAAVIAPRKFLWLAYLIKSFRRIPLKLAAAVRIVQHLHRTILNKSRYGRSADHLYYRHDRPAKSRYSHPCHFKCPVQRACALAAANASVSLTLLPVVVLLNIGLGKTTVLSSVNPKNWKERDAAKLLQLIRRAGVTSIIASPFIVSVGPVL
jgi:hypothetical protein